MTPVCCWCGKGFVKIQEQYWCRTAACRERQAAHAISIEYSPDGDPDHVKTVYLYVPLPRQVEFDACSARYLLGGGAAGSTKSHSCRWSLYRRALKIHDYEALLLRRTWNELEKHHFRLMARESLIFQKYDINVDFSKTNREMTFYDLNAVIEGGHMENADDVDKYLSRERDDISVDEGVTFQPRPLMEISTRARSTKPAVIADGGARFRVYTNPGGAASTVLYDFFIAHEPNWEDFPPALKEKYKPEQWAYIPGMLEDNPYLPPDYESDLAVLTPWRYQQLRHNDWNVVAGQFFAEFAQSVHVMDLGDPGSNVQWFRSMDWGYMNPGVVLWWACLADGIYYIRKEFKFSHATIDIVSGEIKIRTEEMGINPSVMRYTVADPSLTQPDPRSDKIGGETMAETFMRNGIPLLMGKNDRVNGWQRVRELLKLRPEVPMSKDPRRPWLIIHPDCRYLIRTLGSAVSDKSNPEDVDTTIDDHAIDALRYGAMSRPSPTARHSAVNPKSFNAIRKNAEKYRSNLTVR